MTSEATQAESDPRNLPYPNFFLGRDALGIDIQPGVWPTMAVLSERVVCFEVKPGPYMAANDMDFAPWAPREGDAAAKTYWDHLDSQASMNL